MKRLTEFFKTLIRQKALHASHFKQDENYPEISGILIEELPK